jgi:hypothetical protein
MKLQAFIMVMIVGIGLIGCRRADPFDQLSQKLRTLNPGMDTNAVSQLLGPAPRETIRTNGDGQTYRVWIYPLGACPEASIYFTPNGHYQRHTVIGG